MTESPKIPTKPTVRVRIMENDVFHVAVEEAWMPIERPGMRPGDAAFQHAETGFQFLQTVLFYGGPDTQAAQMDVPPTNVPKADRKHVLTEVIGSRMKSMMTGGHTLQPGKVGFTEEDWGWIAVSDCILDGKLYGMMAGYALPECMLVHWMDGPTGQEERIRQDMIKIMGTVFRRSPGDPKRAPQA